MIKNMEAWVDDQLRWNKKSKNKIYFEGEAARLAKEKGCRQSGMNKRGGLQLVFWFEQFARCLY